MAGSQTLRWGLVLLVATAAVTGVVVAVSVRAEPAVYPTIPTWPPFTMVYEANGIVYSVGSSPAETTREVRRLEYRSATQWTDTVVEAPTITTSVGSDSRVGYTAQLNGSSYTESNALGELTYTDTVGENTTRVVGTMPPPFPIEESGVATEPTTTTAKVCFHDECTENAVGLLYRKANGTEFVFVDDARGIPLRVDEAFVVREIRIKDEKQPIAP